MSKILIKLLIGLYGEKDLPPQKPAEGMSKEKGVTTKSQPLGLLGSGG